MSTPTFNNTLNTLIAGSVDALARDPSNETLRTGILQNNVTLLMGQLNLTQIQAANTLRSFTAAYAYSKGQDPKSILDALTSTQQQILNYDANKPTLYGMDLVTANKVASYFALAAGVTLTLSIVAFTIALFMIGPEVAATVTAAGGVVEALSAVTGVAVGTTGGSAIAVGTFLFLISQFLGHISSSIPLWTKQMVDNGTIAASLQITAIKNVAEVQAQLQGGQHPGPFDSQQFSALYNGLTAAGFNEVKDPVTGTIAPLTRISLAGLINYLYGTQIGMGAPATPSKIIPLINAWLLRGGTNNPIPLSLYDQIGGNISAPVSSPNAGGSSAATAPAGPANAPSPVAAPATNIQIYTGVISGGTLGLPQEFHATQSSMISSIDDLTNAAKINLAAVVQSLPGRFYYEIGIVNSITTKSGFQQKGAPVTIVTGYYKNGKPKTKTIYYKFAQMKLGVTDENGRTVKLATINLGPVDVTVFTPSVVQLKDVQNSITGSTFTTDITAIDHVVSPTPPSTSSVPPANPNPPIPQPAPVVTVAPTPTPAPFSIANLSQAPGYSSPNIQQMTPSAGPVLLRNNPGASATVLFTMPYPAIVTLLEGTPMQTVDGYQWRYVNAMNNIGWIPTGTATSAAPVVTPPPAPIASAPNNTAAANATTLYDWYAARALPLPSLQTRSYFYQNAGLGPAGTYVGSADQNNKLLGWLKAHN